MTNTSEQNRSDSSSTEHVEFAIDYSEADPLSLTAFKDDPWTALAAQKLPVGGRTLLMLSDGFFAIDRIPKFLGSPQDPHGLHDHLVAKGMLTPRMPLGVFVWPGEQNVLIDTGFGARSGYGGIMVGGELVRGLARYGLSPDDIDIVALSHLHSDHSGGLAGMDGNPTFRNARVVLGAGDWHHFILTDEAQEPIDAHVRQALMTLSEQDRVTLLEGDQVIAPGITRLDGAGHTPGHSLFLLEDAGERAIMFGDAMYCPQQLTEVDWGAVGDVDPVAAKRTREHYLRDLDRDGGQAIGSHFPALRAGRVLSGAWQSD